MNIEAVKAWSRTVVHDYTSKDSALYAIAIGAVSNPVDSQQLRLVDETQQVLIPSMAAVIASPGFWVRDEKSMEIDVTRLVQGDQRISLQHPLPASGRVVGTSRVSRIVDKGEGKGAQLTISKTLKSESGELYGTAHQLFFCRGDGGFSNTGDADLLLDGDPLPAFNPAPNRVPDKRSSYSIRPDAALLYRLCGDNNRLHIDVQMAARAGFPQPVLHGLATYGYAAVAAIRAFAGGHAEELKGLDARFSAPVYPGEEIEFRMWDEGDYIAIEGYVAARNAMAISHAAARFQ